MNAKRPPKKARKRYVIKDSERGHRPRLNPAEKTKIYTIAVPASLHTKLRQFKPDVVRAHLERLACAALPDTKKAPARSAGTRPKKSPVRKVESPAPRHETKKSKALRMAAIRRKLINGPGITPQEYDSLPAAKKRRCVIWKGFGRDTSHPLYIISTTRISPTSKLRDLSRICNGKQMAEVLFDYSDDEILQAMERFEQLYGKSRVKYAFRVFKKLLRE